MQIMQPLLVNNSNIAPTDYNIGVSQHQTNYLIKMLPKCYLVTRFRYVRFSHKPFAYLSPETKKKGDDNGTY